MSIEYSWKLKSKSLERGAKRLERWKIGKEIQENWRISLGSLMSTSQELKTKRKMKKGKLSNYRKKILEVKEFLHEESLSSTQQWIIKDILYKSKVCTIGHHHKLQNSRDRNCQKPTKRKGTTSRSGKRMALHFTKATPEATRQRRNSFKFPREINSWAIVIQAK